MKFCYRNSTSESVQCIISDGIQHTTPKSIASAMNSFFVLLLNILLPVPVVIPEISHSISRLGFLLSLTRSSKHKVFFGFQLGKVFHVGLGNRVISQQNAKSLK